MRSPSERVPDWALCVVLLVTSVVVYAQYGTDGRLYRDDALYLYAGQEFIKGVPPYVSMFASKGVLSPMLTGVGILIGNAFGLDDLLAARLMFLLLSACTVTAVYLLTSAVLASRQAGILSALTFLCFWGFGRYAMAGPRVKTPMALFEVLALWAMATRRWFIAGVAASLSTLTWQPAGIIAVVAVLMALVASDRGERLRNVSRVVAGGMLPLFLCLAYYAAHDAVPQFFEGFVTASIEYGGRAFHAPFHHRFLRVYNSVSRLDGYMAYGGWIGLAMMVVAYGIRGSARGRERLRTLAAEPFAALLVAFPLVVAWTLFDFQSYPDFFIVLPFAAVGFGWLLHLVASWLAERFGGRAEFAWVALWCVAFIVGGARVYSVSSDHLLSLQEAQVAMLQTIMADQGDDWTLLTFDKPDMNVLLQKRNVTRYVLLIRSIEQMIVDREPGRFRGWLNRVKAQQPDLVYVHSLQIQRRDWIYSWLEQDYVRPNPKKPIWRRKGLTPKAN